RRHPRKGFVIALLLVVLALPDIFFNSTRPLASSNGLRTLLHRPPDPTAHSIFLRSRDEMYFGESSNLEPSYLPAGTAARKIACNHIGLDTTDRPFAYSYILMGIIDNHSSPRDFRYVGVTDRTARFISKIDQQPPCMVLCIHCLHDPGKIAKYSTMLPAVQNFGSLMLFTPAAVPAN
ncbi:MAG: hypothetical protein ABI076_07200, partial [Acidobacteriaceae bacterium]